MATNEPKQVPSPVLDPERLPGTSKYQNLLEIITRQTLTPEVFHEYIAKVRNELGDGSEYRPHDITLEEERLFTAVYQANFGESIRDPPPIRAHLVVANLLAKTLKLDNAQSMPCPSGSSITFYPVLTYRFPSNVISQFLTQIRDYIKQNKNPDSFGILLNVGISRNTKVMCCVFGSKTPLDFKGPKELVYGDCSIPVLVTKNWIPRSAALGNLRASWTNRGIVDPPEISLSGRSMGQCGDRKAGSFGFYVEAQNKDIHAITAAHTIPNAEIGSIIVSPSTAEITGRLEAIVRYTTFSRDSRFHVSNRQSEVQSILDTYQNETSKDGCEIFTKSQTGEPRSQKIVLNGREFGRLTAKSVINKSDMMKEHNTRLENQESMSFNLPTYQPELENGAQSVSILEWSCFKLSDLSRFGKNRLNSGTFDNNAVQGVGLLKAGMEVFKNGRTTGETTGVVNKCILQCWPEDSNVVTTEMVVIGNIGPFADVGDSGSLVTAIEEKLNGVGMLIAKDETGMLAVVTPLWAILEDMEEKTGLGLTFYTEKKRPCKIEN